MATARPISPRSTWLERLERRLVLSGTTDVVLIDAALPDAAVLERAAQGATVVVYDGRRDSAAQVIGRVADLAEGGAKIHSLSILAHGSRGRFELGDQWFSARDLNSKSNAGPWKQLRRVLANDAGIYLYGCDVGESSGGRELVNKLAALTGARVFASNNLTGAGGDWALEGASSGRRNASRGFA